MEYIYTALLLDSVGKKITEKNVEKVLKGAGAKVDEAKVKALISALEGVNIKEVIEKSAIPTAPAAAPAEAKKEEKVEKKKEEKAEEEEKKEEEAASGLATLFED